MEGDFLQSALPAGRWRAFGNIPFSRTTSILRHLLDDPECGPDRADLIVQFEVARKRAVPHPGTLTSMTWLPWWEFTFERRIPRAGFDPPPTVDAAMLVVRRRQQALLDPGQRQAFSTLLRRAFEDGSRPVRHSLAGPVPPMAWKRLARDRRLPVDARPPDLDVWDWVALFLLAAHRG